MNTEIQKPQPAAWLLAAVLLAAGAARGESKKAPVPSPEAQTAIRQQARALYADRFEEAKTDQEKTALAEEILHAALQLEDGTADQYALLDIARGVAAAGGDPERALTIVRAITDRFELQAARVQAETLLAVAKGATSKPARKALAEAAGPVAGELADWRDFATAVRLAEAGRAAAYRAREIDLAKALAGQVEAIKQRQAAHAAYREAAEKLKADPTDPAANQTVGIYLCLEEGDWAQGVSHLALGGESELQAAAVKDLNGAETVEQQLAIADAWWELAEARPETEALMRRAGTWYRRAEPKATGLAKVKIEKQLAAIAEQGTELPEPEEGPPLAIAPFDEKKARGFQKRWSRHLKMPIVDTNSVGMKLVLIPPGEFEMGSKEPAESPKHRVKITRPFYLGACEVTQAEFERVMENNPSNARGRPTQPVEQVTYAEAIEFCRKLSDLPGEEAKGRQYRLPSEAQWEYACRAGTTTRYSFGDDPAQLVRHGWYRKNSGGRPQPVGRLGPNPWGLYDMHGNAWEWCADTFSAEFYARSPESDPLATGSGSAHAVRGSSFYQRDPSRHRSASRGFAYAPTRYIDGGFRVVCAVATEEAGKPEP